MVISWPGVKAEVQVVSTDSTRSRWSRQTKVCTLVADQRARQQVRLAEHLEPVADAEHRHPLAGGRITSVITGANRAIAPQRR